MAKGNLERCLPETLSYEGAFTKDPRDPGNWTGGKVDKGTLRGTNKGIAAASYPTLDIEHLTDKQIAEIYDVKYWRPIRGDDLPIGIDLTTFDYGVNSGPSRSAKDLQRVLGVTADGAIGPQTLKAAIVADARSVVKAHCARRLGFVQSLAIWNTFGRGWAARIAAVEAKGLSWISTKGQLEADAKAARDKAAGQGAGAVVTTGTGVADQINGLSGLPIGWVIAAVVAVVAVLAIRTIINAQRAGSLAQVAKEA